jgi:hypothetical protein
METPHVVVQHFPLLVLDGRLRMTKRMYIVRLAELYKITWRLHTNGEKLRNDT